MKKFNLITVFFLLLTLLGKAQETTSEIQGIVTDSKGAPLAGATIVAEHTPTGTKYSTTSRNDGRYNLANLRIGGPYVITENYVGFTKQQIDNVTLSLGIVFKADFVTTSVTAELANVVLNSTRQNKVTGFYKIGTNFQRP